MIIEITSIIPLQVPLLIMQSKMQRKSGHIGRIQNRMQGTLEQFTNDMQVNMVNSNSTILICPSIAHV